MSFFFSKQTNKKTQTRNINKETLHALQCKACPLNNVPGNEHGKMPARGAESNLAIYFLGEAPGRIEDKEGKPFVGPSGQYLESRIPALVRSQCRFNNVVRSRPPGNAVPQYLEIECCRPSVVADIERTKPPVIVGLGGVPLRWAVGVSGINIWRGRPIPVQIGNHTCWFIATFHPSYLLRGRTKLGLYEGDSKETTDEQLFRMDIAKALSKERLLDKPVVEDQDKLHNNVFIFAGDNQVSEFKIIEKALERFANERTVGIDIETHSDEGDTPRKVRPYGKNATILSCAIGKYSGVYSFLLNHPKTKFSQKYQDKLNDLLRYFIVEAPCEKIAHNLAFELEWFAYFYGPAVFESKWHDSMAQAYVLDGRRGALSLDALIMQRRGFNLKSVYNLDMNQLVRQPLPVLLNYNALDTKYEDLLFAVQEQDLNDEDLLTVYTEQVRRTITLTKTQMKGVRSSDEKTTEHQHKLAAQIERILKDIQDLDIVRKYKSTHSEFNPMSNPQLGDVLQNFLNISDGYRGKDKQYCVDAAVLEDIKHPLAQHVLTLRKYMKAKSTYVDGFKYDANRYVWPDKKVHPVYKSMWVVTRRLSCEEPNMQNFTKRKNRELRSQIIAPIGHWLVACDYGQIEARVVGMASKDPAFVKALWERYDIHQEWAERIIREAPFLGDKSDKVFMKGLRDRTKNKFVFPSLYGASYRSIAPSYGLPVDTTQKLQDSFWKQFSGVRDWQKDLERQYEECGYVELLTGFRCHGPLKYNEIINYPIQGTASDIVLDAMNRLSEKATRDKRPALQAVLNVHDDLTFYIPEDTFDDDVDTIVGEMLRPTFDFINCPISVEVEFGENWYNVESIGTYWSDKW